MIRIAYLISCCVLVVLPACVSKKTYNEEVRRRLEVEDRNLQYTAEVRAVGQRSDRINGTISQLETALAEEQAASAARIAALESEFVQLKSTQADREQRGSARVAELEQELDHARRRLAAIDARFEQRTKLIDQQYARLSGTLTGYPADELQVVREPNGVRIDIAARTLFNNGNYGRIRTDGRQLLTAVAYALQADRAAGLAVEGVGGKVAAAQQMAAGLGTYLTEELGWSPASLRYTARQSIAIPAEKNADGVITGPLVSLRTVVPAVELVE